MHNLPTGAQHAVGDKRALPGEPAPMSLPRHHPVLDGKQRGKADGSYVVTWKAQVCVRGI